jgi:hypothetical protein
MLFYGATQAASTVGLRYGALRDADAFLARASGAGFVFALPEGAAQGAQGLLLSVTDARGRAVWSARPGAGDRSIAWNGRGATPGLYFARLVSTDGRSWLARIAITR